uniref:Uncharacterized protein n=1 Tax=Rhizophora mucronata TaxID=61149 RepID=A0A2P2NL22_RHIMU
MKKGKKLISDEVDDTLTSSDRRFTKLHWPAFVCLSDICRAAVYCRECLWAAHRDGCSLVFGPTH